MALDPALFRYVPPFEYGTRVVCTNLQTPNVKIEGVFVRHWLGIEEVWDVLRDDGTTVHLYPTFGDSMTPISQEDRSSTRRTPVADTDPLESVIREALDKIAADGDCSCDQCLTADIAAAVRAHIRSREGEVAKALCPFSDHSKCTYPRCDADWLASIVTITLVAEGLSVWRAGVPLHHSEQKRLAEQALARLRSAPTETLVAALPLVGALLDAASADLDGRHPMQYGFRDGHAVIGYDPEDVTVVERMNRCPTCEEWSPCSLRQAVLALTPPKEDGAS